jgi:aspartyl protease family protein
VFVVGIVALVIGLMVVFPNAPGLKVDSTRLVYLLVLLAVVVASVGSLFSESPGRTVRHVAIWTGIAAGLALLYSFRGELGMAKDRVVGQAMPAQGVAKPGPVGQRTITLYTQGGHFFAEAEVEGKKVMFIIDTGASDVVLSRQDAARVGIDPEPRDFTKTYETANGMVRGAPVVLDSVAIGPIDVRNVDASVTESDMTVSLLGMSFLNRLKGYQVDGDTLILKQ